MAVPVDLGPIRPPSEATSLLIRVTRNCPWNHCAFCPVYKDTKFSIRTVEDIARDIHSMARIAELLRTRAAGHPLSLGLRRSIGSEVDDPVAVDRVAAFLAAGGSSAFLQDANSLISSTESLVEVLGVLKETFASISEVTTYARTHTVLTKTDDELRELRKAGLTRIHVGIESGADEVLSLVKKGVTAKQHIEAGQRLIAAGFELCCYVMPGLGGVRLSKRHVDGTAHVLNEIQPHVIRFRTTAIAPDTALEQLAIEGKWHPMGDEAVLRETEKLIERLEVSAHLASDHSLNLLPELEGQLPSDRKAMLAVLKRFRGMEPRLRRAFVLARRGGLVTRLEEMSFEPARESALHLLERVEQSYDGDLDAAVRDLMSRQI